jgi:hypothetical protein
MIWSDMNRDLVKYEQAGRESGPSVPAQRQANSPKSCGQSMGLAAIGCGEVRQALGENATRTGRVSAEEPPDCELEMYGARPPREVRQVALIAAMDGRCRHCTARAGGGRRCRGELEPNRGLLQGHLGEAHSAR